MKKLIAIFIFLLSFSMFSQNTVKFGAHLIEVDNSISYNTVNKFIDFMGENPINYEDSLRTIIQIKSIKANKNFLGSMDKGVITLNKRLDKLPYTKEVVILHYLAVNSGMKGIDSVNPHVSSLKFIMSDRNETFFKLQLSEDEPYKYIVNKLKKEAPLRSKL